MSLLRQCPGRHGKQCSLRRMRQRAYAYQCTIVAWGSKIMTLKRFKAVIRNLCDVEDLKLFFNDSEEGWQEILDIAVETIVLDGQDDVEVLMLRPYRGSEDTNAKRQKEVQAKCGENIHGSASGTPQAKETA